MGSKVHQAVHEGTCKAGLGRTCPHQEEEAAVVQERRRAEIPIQGEQILSINFGQCKIWGHKPGQYKIWAGHFGVYESQIPY